MENKINQENEKVEIHDGEESIHTSNKFFDELIRQKVAEGMLKPVNPDADSSLTKMSSQQQKELKKFIKEMKRTQKNKTKDVNKLVNKFKADWDSVVLGTYVLDKSGWFAYLTNIDDSSDKIKTIWYQIPYDSKEGDVLDLIVRDELENGETYYMFYLNKQKTIQHKEGKNGR